MQAFKTLAIQHLKGKMVWQNDNFSEKLFPKKESTLHTVALVDNVFIAEHMINFTVEPYQLSEEYWSYQVHLLANDNGTTYSGHLKKGQEGTYCGKITCELFTNVNRHLLHGKWIEGNVEYSWQSIIERK